MKICSLTSLATLLFLLMCGNRITAEGYLQLFGTDPFSQVALVSEEHGRLYLEMEADRLDSLWAGRTGRVRITGELYEDTLSTSGSSRLRVEDWVWLDRE